MAERTFIAIKPDGVQRGLVGEILGAWREEFCRMISLKLHSFFLMPFCDNLPAYMRQIGRAHV